MQERVRGMQSRTPYDELAAFWNSQRRDLGIVQKVTNPWRATTRGMLKPMEKAPCGALATNNANVPEGGATCGPRQQFDLVPTLLLQGVLTGHDGLPLGGSNLIIILHDAQMHF